MSTEGTGACVCGQYPHTDACVNQPANDNGQPLIRKGQTWLFQGQTWKVHDVLTEGVIVLIGPYNRRDLNGVTAEELYLAGRLQAEPRATAVSKKAERLAAQLERQRTRLASRPMGRPKKPKPDAVLQPWRCALLAVDTANNSGWSIWVDGELRSSGEAKKDQRDSLIHVCKLVHAYDRPAVLVTESAAGFVYPGRGASTLIALGQARQAWLEAWSAAGGLKTRRVSVVPSRWRGQLWGGGLKKTLGRGKTHADFERDWAVIQLKKIGVEDADAQTIEQDRATAICIGSWAVRSGEVGAALPIKLRVAA